MKPDDVYKALLVPNDSKIALVVLDGLGDIATEETDYRTPLEAARTPNLDGLAKRSALGRMIPVAPGITPGSGPGHLGLFGYDPLEFEVGRGVIEALGLGFDLRHGDVAARANFCSLDAKGVVTDRRAGRIDTKVCEAQCALLSGKIKKIDDIEVFIRPGKGHRFVVVFRGQGLEGPLSDTDPHREGSQIATAKPLIKSTKAAKTAKVVATFYQQALPLLKNCKPANGFLLRGIAHQPKIPLFEERYGLKSAAIAIYPMYKGLAQLVGMKKVEGPTTVRQELEAAVDALKVYDFVFVHIKGTDMAGEDGNFDAKVKAIEEVDAALGVLLRAKPSVIAITGDHSTPVPVKGHSWHPQPVMICSEIAGWDGQDRFTERTSNQGSLGVFEAKYLIRHLQANARRLDKFGA
ncbi:MAG TPA: 2,3-bisphosphoglycerate-independent phosphoglycerate mutase [Verrucomicrobiae bacterium]|nr:2,3-bisphosphoglycerate-independent phosphoglycerate mutase [Verrucomicrobiae bacterium]